MNKVLIAKDVAYAAKKGGGTVASSSEIKDLEEGAFAILSSKGVVLATTNVGAEVANTDYVEFAIGRKNDVQVVVVPRKNTYQKRVDYRAYVKPVITVGGITTAKALTISSTGDATIRISDVSFTSRYNVDLINVSAYKTASMTNEAFVDKLVEKINTADESFVIASKVNSGSNFGITITPKENGVSISVQLSEMFEGNNIEQTTSPVYGSGSGVDILQLEKDASVEEGNGNYVDYTNDYFKVPTQTDESSNYDLTVFNWEGVSKSPSSSKSVMHNILTLATIEGAANGQEISDFITLWVNIFGQTDGSTGVNSGIQDGTDNDGTAGN